MVAHVAPYTVHIHLHPCLGQTNTAPEYLHEKVTVAFETFNTQISTRYLKFIHICNNYIYQSVMLLLPTSRVQFVLLLLLDVRSDRGFQNVGRF